MLLGELAVSLRDASAADEALRRKEAKITELQRDLGRREHEVDEMKKHLNDVEAEVSARRSGVCVYVRVCMCVRARVISNLRR